MSTMIAEVYEAFKEAGVSETQAMAAARSMADKETEFGSPEPRKEVWGAI